ncbi:hypothetical protein EYZ11_011254 [Aspergillus tanneri]|uniref:Dihydroxy-acid/6-phosphogluconate dehydratase N-terminal domain-containing protein n=1 Tax=Aspergillus tanneri TaxID=1220188 RepID=A0A4S3J3A1_9EURO|nr:hypothetical protein EYZ11_011254 [Aspergillus tanneri]
MPQDLQATIPNEYSLSQNINSNTGFRQALTTYGDAHFSLFLRKVFIKALGYTDDALSRPIIGIINTNSGFNPCHGNASQLIEAAKRGIMLSGGIAIDFPTISLHEGFSHPTSMFLRNLMSMDTEEMIRAQPVDACIMIGGLAGKIDMEEIMAINEELAPTIGTCGVMGTASTMACITAALGLIPLQGASAPAVSASRLRVAEQTGILAVAAAKEQRVPQDILSLESFYNAAIVLQAIGGSTNAMVHLMAIINRHPNLKGVTLKTLDDIGLKTPLLVDLKPSGDNYMTDFHNAGGMLCLLHQLRPLLYLSARTISGETLVVYGNIAPNGAVIKVSASKDKRLLRHTGPVVVFENSKDLALRLDDPDLNVIADSILVLKGIGPIGNPGMPEAGMIPIPRKLAEQGVTDMLRMSDGRMSGTAGGTIILHISPESAIPDSPFGVVQTGDFIMCDVEARKLELCINEEEFRTRISARQQILSTGTGDEPSQWVQRHTRRGYRGLYERTVNQAHEGADFSFLTATGN